MPYVITTKTPASLCSDAEPACQCPDPDGCATVTTRRAFATLNEAMRDVIAEYEAATGKPVPPRFGLFASGGTVGPLPDGTVIEVERVDWPRLAGGIDGGAYMPEAEIIAAFNAAQEDSR